MQKSEKIHRKANEGWAIPNGDSLETMHISSKTRWGFLKEKGVPQVTMGFNTKMVQFWMTWGTLMT